MTKDTHILKRRFHIPFIKKIEHYLADLSLFGALILYTLVFIFGLSALVLLVKVNNSFLVEVPSRGGTLHEGIIGLPQFINPVLAVTDGDKDLSALVYSGLLKRMPDGTLVPDLAESYTISPDNSTYTFTLKKNLTFQDGKALTADDVVFTIHEIQNPVIKSSLEADWNGVTVTKIDDTHVQFVLKEPYAAFIENTTVGILPQHLWSSASPETFSAQQLNIKPIGSGPYQIADISRNKSDVPESYTLIPFSHYRGGEAYISKIIISFYTTEKNLVDAYKNGDITSMNSISPDTAETLKNQGAPLLQASLPRVFAVFFNQQNNKALAQKEVRQALNEAVDKHYIVDTVLRGFGSPLDSFAPKSFTSTTGSLVSASSSTFNLADANKLLDTAGWKVNQAGIREKKIGKDIVPLSFSISTGDAPELKEVADIVQSQWQHLGADVTVKIMEGGYLNQNIIKPRKYDALLFGQVINPDLDVYAFWHSTQIQDPGLNVALYSNKKADTLLDQLRTTTDSEIRNRVARALAQQINTDLPAVFLYSPSFIYVVPPELQNITMSEITTPSDRFGSVNTWHLTTEKIWNIFVHNNNNN